MQSLTEIKQLLEQFGLAPQKRFGQNFLIDQNLLRKIVDLADVRPDRTVLEVGPGTGSLTQELLARAGRVVAVEIDSGMFRLLSHVFAGQDRIALIHDDALAGKHAMSPQVLDVLGPKADLVANLPYNVATPLVAQLLVLSWRAIKGQSPACLIERLTFTVQQEVADRMIASPQSSQYGPVSVMIALLGRLQAGPVVPNTAFWPKPQVVSRAVRIDFDAAQAAELSDIDALKALLNMTFTQRRKQVHSAVRRKNAAFAPEDFEQALAAGGIDPAVRPEQITPWQFRRAANALAGKLRRPPIGDEEL